MLSYRTATPAESRFDRHGLTGIKIPLSDPYNAPRVRVGALNALRFPIGFEVNTPQNKQTNLRQRAQGVGRVAVANPDFATRLLELDSLTLPEFSHVDSPAGPRVLAAHPSQLIEAIDYGEPDYARHYLDLMHHGRKPLTRSNLDLETIVPACLVAATERFLIRERAKSPDDRVSLEGATERQYSMLRGVGVQPITAQDLQGLTVDYYALAANFSPEFAKHQRQSPIELVRPAPAEV